MALMMVKDGGFILHAVFDYRCKIQGIGKGILDSVSQCFDSLGQHYTFLPSGTAGLSLRSRTETKESVCGIRRGTGPSNVCRHG